MVYRLDIHCTLESSKKLIIFIDGCTFFTKPITWIAKTKTYIEEFLVKFINRFNALHMYVVNNFGVCKNLDKTSYFLEC